MLPESERQSDQFRSSDASSSSAVLDVDDFDELLTSCLEQLLMQGPLSAISDLRGMLPTTDEDSRQFVLVELIKVDMAMTAESGKIRRIQDYSDALPDLLPMDSVPLDLVMEEIQLRKELGEIPSRDEYDVLFPRYQSMFDHLHHPTEATTACRKLKPPPEFVCGKQIDDFLLIQQLGKGAFATVYLALQISMQRLVALKISRGSGDESQSLAQFDHTNIVRVFDQRGLSEEKVHLLYMQFHPGGTLADVVKAVRACEGKPTGRLLLNCVDRNLQNTNQTIPESSASRTWIESASWPAIVAWIGTQLAHALNDAHDHGVLHRDVKPANVLMSAEGIPKLADFNVSFAGSAGRAGAAASFGGSIGYMSPEHLRAIQSHTGLVVEKVEEPADLYSLAVLLWELWQGYRPFVNAGIVPSWSEAIAQQMRSRELALVEPKRLGGASERVLEQVLRSALSYRPDDRPKSGDEMAGKLRLALHPNAAALFDIRNSVLRSRLLNLSPWLLATLIILVPNIVGGIINFLYNYNQVMTTPAMKDGLVQISWFVNLTFFPLGACIIIYFALTVIRAVSNASLGKPVSPNDVEATLTLGHRSAVVGGALWLIGGMVFPIALYWMFPDFTFSQAIHLVISSLVCGGIAMVYPFFGMAIVTSWIYYPCYVQQQMEDPLFTVRQKRMIRSTEMYLLIAALIPLLGATLMISNQSFSRTFTLVAVGACVTGLLVSAIAYRLVGLAWSRMAEFLTEK